MAKLRGVVLAAGRGVRMGGETPKTLIPIGSHEPMLHHLLAELAGAGVDDLVVVTGFEAARVQEFTTEHWDGDNVTFIRNMRWASWGNFHSVRLALDQSPGFDALVVNSDIVIAPEVFGRVLETRGDLVLAVEQRYGLDQEDMRVRLDEDRVVDIGKDLKLNLSQGEFCGVSLLRPPAHPTYRDIASDVEWQRGSWHYYEDMYREMIGRVDVRAAQVRSGEYAEVDTPEDIAAAVEVLERVAARSAPA